MISYRVDDLDALLVDLAAAGVWIDPKRQNESYGRFAWIKDCDGNRLELWQPLESSVPPVRGEFAYAIHEREAVLDAIHGVGRPTISNASEARDDHLRFVFDHVVGARIEGDGERQQPALVARQG